MKKYRILFLLLFSLLFFACGSHKAKPKTLRIAVSKAVPEKSYRYYRRWLKYGDSTVEIFDMYHLGLDSALKMLANCDALLLTGGEDIEARRYGLEDTAHWCAAPNLRRDSIEFALIAAAYQRRMPIMGICRGHQLINAYFGGTLYFDIPKELGTSVVHRCARADTCFHAVRIVDSSLLFRICGVRKGRVNSAHHQGVRNLAPGFLSNATSGDALIESISIADSLYPFLLGVQWHPERLNYDENPLSGKIAKYFLKKARAFAKK